MVEQKDNIRLNWIIAAFLAWILPGAGHVYLRRPVRGAIIFATIVATFWAGVAVGGVMTVDRRHEPWWFTAQMLAGINGLVGWQRSEAVYREITREGPIPVTVQPGIDPYLARRMAVDDELGDKALVAPEGTVARAYAGVAGMLNLMCIFDAAVLSIMGVRGESKRLPKPEGDGGRS